MGSLRRGRWVTLGSAVVLVLLVSTGTWAAYTAATTNSGNSASSGSVGLTDNDGGSSAMFTLSSLGPNDTTSRCIKVTYNGSLASNVRLYGTTGGSGLAPHLGLTVTRGSYSSDPGFSSCTNFVPDGTTYESGQAPGVVYAGTLDDFGDSYASGLTDRGSGGSTEDWTSGESHVYKFQVTQGANPAAEGKNATQTFTWEARNGDGYKPTVLSNAGLVGYWRFGESSGTTASDSDAANDGTYVGGPSLGQAGALSGDSDTAVGFDGVDDRVTVPDAASLDLNGFTVETWIYLTSYGTTTTFRTILMKGATATERNYALWLNANDNAKIHYSFGTAGGTYVSGTGNTDLSLNNWHHVAFVHQPGTKNQLYINGKLDAETPTTATPATSTAPVSIGGPSSSYGWITGRLDETAIYNTPLSAAQVQQHYTEGTGG